MQSNNRNHMQYKLHT